MFSESESDEFYDAEDDTASHSVRKSKRLSKENLRNEPTAADNSPQQAADSKLLHTQIDEDDVFRDPNNLDIQTVKSLQQQAAGGGRRKFKELRQKLQTDDDDGQMTTLTPPNSQTSSVEGVYAVSSTGSTTAGRVTHPFRVIEVDTLSLQSINSLGRVGRILSGSDNGSVTNENVKSAPSVSALSVSSHDSESTTPTSCSGNSSNSKFPSTLTLPSTVEPYHHLQEPDVIASTKSNNKHQVQAADADNSKEHLEGPPIAPPRRKKKIVKHLPSSSSSQSLLTDDHALSASSSSRLLTNAALETLKRELEGSYQKKCEPVAIIAAPKTSSNESSKSASLQSRKSLDLRQIVKGQFVVKPQDNDMHKATADQGPTVSCSNRTDNEQFIIELQPESQKSTTTTGGVRFNASRNSVGHYSLGSYRNSHKQYQLMMTKASKERRRSAGDELNFVRTRSDSGKHLSDLEILEQVTVLNLDTGERIPLSVAEEKIPQCINPLSLHIMRLTSEYVSSSSMEKDKESDEESVDTKKSSDPPSKDDVTGGIARKRTTAKLKRFFGTTVKKTMHKAMTIAHEVSSHARHKEDVVDLVDEVHHPGEHYVKLKASNSHKGPYEFEKIQQVQEFLEHEGAIWCMKFSCCGRLLATAGQDKVLRIWVLKEAFPFFQDMRTKYNAEKVSPTPSQESLVSHNSNENGAPSSLATMMDTLNYKDDNKEDGNNKLMIFMPKPFCTYTGHTSDLLDVAWSKNYFLLSSSMDKTVRLWHISRKECLCCFQHIDFVTAIVFHPRDDRYFLSGSLDGKIRLWNIPDKKVAVWNEVEGTTKLITAANFCQNGKFAVVGSYDGRCIFYTTDQMKYHTQINVRSTRGKNAIGRKISGIEPMPGEDKILVTSNDSRIRLYDLRDLSVSCKYKGYLNLSSQIKASFSHDGKYIVSGSENRDIYIWKTNHDYAKFTSARRDRNDYWEAIKAHNATVTCAIFAPNPDGIFKLLTVEDEDEEEEEVEETEEEQKVEVEECRAKRDKKKKKKKNGEEFDKRNVVQDPMVEQHRKGGDGYVLISADFNGCIKVFINRMKPKHSSLPASAIA